MNNLSAGSLLEYWLNRIRADLAPFADPGGEVQITKQGRNIHARWSQRAVDRSAVFLIAQDSIKVATPSREYGYRAFFAGSEMADLPSLARMIQKARSAQIYVDTKAKFDSLQGPRTTGALDCIREALGPQYADEAT